jgi:CRP-like cAMP-binding protein
MTSLAALAVGLPLARFSPGEALTTEGSHSGRLYILETGALTVVRDGVTLATIDEPGAIVGEMAVLLGIPHSATVKALTLSTARVVDDAMGAMGRNPDLAIAIATTACARLNATSALLVELRREASGKAREQALMSRILMALAATPKGGARIDHE